MSTSINVNDDNVEQQYSLLGSSQVSPRNITTQQRYIRYAAITFTALLSLFISYKLGQYSLSGSVTPVATSDIVKQIQTNVTNTIVNAMDTSVDPCNDFYQYACGGWLNSDAAVIPDDKGSIDLVMHNIELSTTETLHSILTSSTQWPLISKFYELCMDTDAIDAVGIPNSITHQLQQIDQLSVIYTENNNTMPWPVIFTEIANMHLSHADVLFSFGAGADIMNPDINIAQLSQGGIALPDITYYTNTDTDSKQILQQYQQHISTVLQSAGKYSSSDANKYAADAVAFETLIAQYSQPEVELRNITATYNILNLNQFLTVTADHIPNIAFLSYLQTLGLYPTTDNDKFIINVQSIQWLTNLCQLINNTNIEQLQGYMRWQTIHSVANLLPSNIANENFRFFGTVLNGLTTQLPRYKQCIRSTDNHLGQLLGRYYVQSVFDEESKQLAIKLMSDIVNAMNTKLQAIQWLDESTRSKAIEKLSQLREQIGYPNKWEQYIGLEMYHTSYYDDVLASVKWSVNRDIQDIGKFVDKDRWQMTTPTINAYFEPTLNAIVMPAGILTGLYFNKYYHPAINYGNTATTFGHELTHSFDDQGSQFDGTGKFNNWWSDSVQVQWQQRTECLANWYSKYEVLPGIHLDGELTCGENIADVGGIKQSYTAYQTHMNSGDAILDGVDVYSNYIDSYTNEQLFFISYAQGWCSNNRPELAKIRVLTDPHSDSRSRVNGPVSMFSTFGKTFNCKAGDPMMPQPEQLCDIW